MSDQRQIILPTQKSFVVTAVPPVHSSPNAVRDLLTVLFRNRKIIETAFVCTFLGAIFGVFLLGIKYESDTQILVKHRRADEVVSTDSNSRDQQSSTDVPTEREINTEISLLKSGDLMAEVAKASGLDRSERHFWDFLFPERDDSWRAAKAAKKLSEGLKISEVPQSNMIRISYRASRPEITQRVLSNLDKFYLAKHLAVYRPPGIFDFFHNQTAHYQDELERAERELASYDMSKDASDPELDKEILLRKAGEFDGDLHATEAAISQTDKRIRELNHLLGKTPDRLTTQVTAGDNPQLLAFLKSNLADLETKRTDLLTKYQPTYRLVQEVDKQIADLKSAIAAENGNPVHQESTGENPTYELLKAELVKANEDLTGFTAKARATAPVVETYRQQALLMDQKGIERQDLVRSIKAAEENYLLYVQKQEQARISDELDQNRILNVAIAEAPGFPALPVYSPWLLVVASGVLALMISIALAFAADYLDPSFRTPEELVEFLDVPLLASFARNGHPPQFRLLGNGPSPQGVAMSPVNRTRSGVGAFLSSNPLAAELGKFFGLQRKRR